MNLVTHRFFIDLASKFPYKQLDLAQVVPCTKKGIMTQISRRLQLQNSIGWNVLFLGLFILISPGRVAGQICTPPPAGLVGWWPGENSAADLAVATNGTLVGNTTYTNGFVGKAFSFDGSADAVALGNPPALRVQDFTIEMWIQRYDSSITTPASYAAGLLHGGGGGIALGIYNEGWLFLSKVGTSQVLMQDAPITDTGWHHVAVTKSGTNVQFYVDGIAYSSFVYDPGFSFGSVQAIGARADSLVQGFLGAIDETSMYNRPLDAFEIAAIYNASSAGKCNTAVGPSITQQPSDTTGVTANPVSLKVLAAGSPPIFYQWQRSSNNVPGGTNYLLNFSNLQSSNAGIYRVIVSNYVGSITSDLATLSVAVAPTITNQPRGFTNFAGSTALFSAGVTGDAPLTYTWRFNGVDLADDGRIVGSQTATLAVTNIQPADEGNYTLYVVNPYGSVTSSVAVLAIAVPAAIIEQPTNQTVLRGASPTFRVTAVGTPPPSYQWQAHGTNLPGATSSSLTLGNVQASQAGAYQAMVTNIYGSATSDVATLTVLVPVSIITQPQGWTNLPGTTALFLVSAAGTPPLSFQWRFNGTNLPGATQYGLTITNAQIPNAGMYTVVVTNSFSAVTSSPAFLALNLPPTITTQPQSQTAPAGANVSFNVTASGVGTLSYQWRFGSTNLPGATNSILSLYSIQSSNMGNYTAFVSNTNGTVASSNATLTITNPLCFNAPTGLVAWWQAEGTPADSISGSAGTLIGNTTYAPGMSGNAFSFDGNGDVVVLGNSPATQLQDFTIEAWIKRGSTNKTTASAGNAELVCYGQSGYGFGILDDGHLFLTAVGINQVVGTFQFTDTNWHHVAVSKVGTSIVFYLDGIGYPASNYGGTFSFATSLGVGARSDNLNNSFLGLIDEASIYNHALSSNEVRTIYNATSAGKCALAPAWTLQPSNQVTVISSNVVFTPLASGSRPLAYQWYLNGAAVAKATNSSLAITGVGYYHLGSYNVVTTNSAGAAASSNALLSITLPPVVKNGSFETGNSSNWTITDISQPFAPLAVRSAGYDPGYGFFLTAPSDGGYCLTAGFDGNGPGRTRAAMDVVLPAGPLTLSFNWRAGWDMYYYGGATLPRTFSVVIEPFGGGLALQTNVILTAMPGTANYDTGNRTNSVDLTGFAGRSVRICFDLNIPEYFTGPGFFQLDNVVISYTPVPPLAIGVTNQSVVLSWPNYFTNFGPISAASLATTSVWTSINTNLIVRGPTNNSLSQPIAPGNKYYRLKSP